MSKLKYSNIKWKTLTINKLLASFQIKDLTCNNMLMTKIALRFMATITTTKSNQPRVPKTASLLKVIHFFRFFPVY